MKKTKQQSNKEYNTKKKRARKRADKLWQKLIIELNPKCLCCGKKTEVGHHFIRKSKSNYLRYAVKNGINLCNKCHYELHSWREGELNGLIVIRKGEEWFNDLVRDKNKMVSTTLGWYLEKIKALNKAIK